MPATARTTTRFAARAVPGAPPRRAAPAPSVTRDFYVVTPVAARASATRAWCCRTRCRSFYPGPAARRPGQPARWCSTSASPPTPLPRWPLAHPFRLLAHNGEINTIEGNRRWAQARAQGVADAALRPRASSTAGHRMHGSDSQSLDNMLELLLAGGMDLLQAMRILIPPATQSLEYKDADLAAFYEYYAPQHRAVGRPGRHRRCATAATPPARSTATACARRAGC